MNKYWHEIQHLISGNVEPLAMAPIHTKPESSRGQGNPMPQITTLFRPLPADFISLKWQTLQLFISYCFQFMYRWCAVNWSPVRTTQRSRKSCSKSLSLFPLDCWSIRSSNWWIKNSELRNHSQSFIIVCNIITTVLTALMCTELISS